LNIPYDEEHNDYEDEDKSEFAYDGIYDDTECGDIE
jgi:hypothetical protein